MIILQKFPLVIAILVTWLVVAYAPASAQLSLPTLSTGQGLQMSVSPLHPRAAEIIQVRVHGFSQDIKNSEIVWYVNDVETQRGVGLDKFTVRTGSIGSYATISASLFKADGTILEGRILIQPAEVDLVWEADTTAPAFYRGKALYTEGSRLRLIAMPRLMDLDSGQILSADELVYKWSQDGRVLESASGYGRSTMVVREISRLRSNTMINVEVSAPSGAGRAVGSAFIEPSREISVKIYQSDPLLGVRYEKSIEEEFALGVEQREVGLIGEPYHFNLDNMLTGDLEYNWKMNGQRIYGGRSRASSQVTLTANDRSGRASLEVSVENLVSILQEARKTIMIEFGRR